MKTFESIFRAKHAATEAVHCINTFSNENKQQYTSSGQTTIEQVWSRGIQQHYRLFCSFNFFSFTFILFNAEHWRKQTEMKISPKFLLLCKSRHAIDKRQTAYRVHWNKNTCRRKNKTDEKETEKIMKEATATIVPVTTNEKRIFSIR